MSLHNLTLILSLGLGFAACTASAQNDPRPRLPDAIEVGPGIDRVPVRTAEQQEREQLQKMFALRQAEIRRDTEKLVQLTTELKQYLDGASGNVLSVDMIKKAETIEKLARNVKRRMKENE